MMPTIRRALQPISPSDIDQSPALRATGRELFLLPTETAMFALHPDPPA